MVDFEKDDAAAFRRSGLRCSPLQKYSLTPGRSELIRLGRAMSNWEQDPTGIFSGKQHAVIASAGDGQGSRRPAATSGRWSTEGASGG
jgi:hypothetical protein